MQAPETFCIKICPCINKYLVVVPPHTYPALIQTQLLETIMVFGYWVIALPPTAPSQTAFTLPCLKPHQVVTEYAEHL